MILNRSRTDPNCNIEILEHTGEKYKDTNAQMALVNPVGVNL